MNICIIPARGGSKRIPRKNIRIFAGKPIIAYSIEAALSTGLFDRILVSTDDDEIAEVAKAYGADVPFLRPKALADDYTGTNDVVKHALQWLQEAGTPADYACCIYATAPLIQPVFIHQGYDRIIATGTTFAFSVTSFPFPIQRAIRINAEKTVEPFYPKFISARSQDLEEAYHDAGQFYWGTTKAFINDEEIFLPPSIPIVIPRHLVQDIDTPEDWQRAELMYTSWQASVKYSG